jgi:hypothetical protein
VSQTHLPGRDGGGISLIVPLILILLAVAAWALTRVMRRPAEAAPAPEPAASPVTPARPWRPHRQSTMEGPGWTEEPPEWSDPPPSRR